MVDSTIEFLSDMKALARSALRRPPELQSAALCYRTTKKGPEYLLITSRRSGRWIIPKGWPQKRRTLAGTAEREAWEEAGARGEIANEAIGSYKYDKSLGAGLIVRCEAKVYPLEVSEVEKSWPEKRQRKRKWLNASEASQRVSDPALSRLIEEFDTAARAAAA